MGEGGAEKELATLRTTDCQQELPLALTSKPQGLVRQLCNQQLINILR
jgi:hypothetical protein